MDVNTSKLFIGKSFEIANHIYFKPPTPREILEIGQEQYLKMVKTFCLTPCELKWQLYDSGIWWDEIDDYELFIKFLHPMLDKKCTSVLFGNILDFSKMQVVYDDKLKQHKLVQLVTEITSEVSHVNKSNILNKNKPVETIKHVEQYEIVITRYTYIQMTNYIRALHALEYKHEVAGNKLYRELSIEIEREEYMAQLERKDGNKNSDGQIVDVICYLLSEGVGNYSHDTILDLNYYVITKLVKRTTHKEMAKILLNSGYSGFGIDLKKFKNKEQLDFLGG